MKRFLIAACIMIFSAFAVQASPGGPGSGSFVGAVGPGGAFNHQLTKATNSLNAGAVVQNANFERLHGAAAPAIAGKPSYTQVTTSIANATSHGVLGGGSIGISKAATA